MFWFQKTPRKEEEEFRGEPSVKKEEDPHLIRTPPYTEAPLNQEAMLLLEG